MAVSSTAPARSAGGPSSSCTRRMNAGLARRVEVDARARRSPRAPPGRPTSRTARPCSPARRPARPGRTRVAGRRTSATRHSRPSRLPSAASRASERPASSGRSPRATSRSAHRRPVYPVAPKTTILEGIAETRTRPGGQLPWIADYGNRNREKKRPPADRAAGQKGTHVRSARGLRRDRRVHHRVRDGSPGQAGLRRRPRRLRRHAASSPPPRRATCATSTSCRSPWTSRSGCTRPGRSPARSSSARAARASPRP